MSIRLKIAVVFLSCVIFRSPGFAQNSSSQDQTTGKAGPAQQVSEKGTITILSPADGSTVDSFPTTFQISFSGGVRPASAKALLNGVDITSQFAPADSAGTRQAVLNRPVLNLGKNQLQVSVGKLKARATFVVDLAGPGGSPSAASQPSSTPTQTSSVTGDGSQNNAANISPSQGPSSLGSAATLTPASGAAGQVPPQSPGPAASPSSIFPQSVGLTVSAGSDTPGTAKRKQFPQITILAPASGSLANSLPVTLQVQFANVDPTTMQALLDSVDITSTFGAADSSGIRTASVNTPAINLGKNQLQINVPSLQVQAVFHVDLNNSIPASGSPLPLLVPIKTRVLCSGCDGSSETDWNIGLYQDPSNPSNATYITAPPLPAGSKASQGFQIVYLRRSDLAVISNQSVPNPSPPTTSWGGTGIAQALQTEPPAMCGSPQPGCILIIQSLQTIGYAACYVSGDSNCQPAATASQNAGASGRWTYANGSNWKIGYSFIGNISAGPNSAPPVVPAGTYYERLTCSDTNTSNSTDNACDALGNPSTSNTAPSGATPDQIGNMSGALVRDNNFTYTYVQTAPAITYSSQYDSTNISHAFTINSNTIWSGFATGSGAGGIHVVVVDRTNPNILIQNQWWPSDVCADEVGNHTESIGAYNLIGQYNTYGYLIFVASFGGTAYDPMVSNCT